MPPYVWLCLGTCHMVQLTLNICGGGDRTHGGWQGVCMGNAGEKDRAGLGHEFDSANGTGEESTRTDAEEIVLLVPEGGKDAVPSSDPRRRQGHWCLCRYARLDARSTAIRNIAKHSQTCKYACERETGSRGQTSTQTVQVWAAHSTPSSSRIRDR